MRPLRLPFRRGRLFIWSPTARLILASNLAGLLVLIAGALVLNEVRSTLVQARKESLREMGEIISSFITETATDTLPYDDDRLCSTSDKASYQLKRDPAADIRRPRGCGYFPRWARASPTPSCCATRSTRPSCRT